MGYLEQVLAAVDNAKRVAGRNVSDLVSDPAAYAERLTDHLRNSNRNVVPTASPTELTNRPMTQEEVVDKYVGAAGDTLNGGLGVIKPKGGNWLSGKYGPESRLSGLKKEGRTLEQAIAEAPIPLTPEAQKRLAEIQHFPDTTTATNNSALNNWIDQKLTKYIKNDMASPTDPIRLMAEKFPAEKAQKLAEAEARVQALRQKQQAQAATRGVPEEMLTRTRQDVLKAEEARDVIAENKGLHYNVVPIQEGYATKHARENRVNAGFPIEGMGQSPLAKAWELDADLEILRRPAKDFQLPNNLKQDPWLTKVDPEVPVYSAMSEVGRFEHLTDELANSLREGRLTPEALGKMPIDQAVKHVAEVNALRAVNASKARAMDMADMPIHKEYPDTGYSWRQLKHEDEPTLQKWLTQEGDAMGHCVGGYCPDVKSGASNIFSLRDAKGNPHVTIETGPDAWGNNQYVNAATDAAHERAIREGLTEDHPDYPEALEKYTNEALRQDKNAPQSILQIKGKNNDVPSLHAMPMIQDFIKSGKWSNIQDAGHTGMSQEELNAFIHP